MSVLAYDEILEQVDHLKPAEQKALMAHLQAKWKSSARVTRELIVAEMAQKRAAGAYENVESLRNKYANEDFENVTGEEIREYLTQLSREWEAKIDRYFTED